MQLFKEFLVEAKTSKADHMKGLKGWVEDYKAMRKAGNVKGAKQAKANIDKVIKKEKLNSKEVYGKDPDDPKNESTRTKAVLGGKTKLYMITTKNGKDIVLVAQNDKDAKQKASLIGDDIKKVVRLNRKHQDLYTI